MYYTMTVLASSGSRGETAGRARSTQQPCATRRRPTTPRQETKPRNHTHTPCILLQPRRAMTMGLKCSFFPFLSYAHELTSANTVKRARAAVLPSFFLVAALHEY